MIFKQFFQKGALLGIVWTNGRIGFHPFYFSSSEKKNQLLL
jgi:hypothetical protein